jgi:hypothetical protein
MIRGLVPGQRYDFTIQVVNETTGLFSAGDPLIENYLVPGDTQAPATPTGLAVASQKLTSLTLRWTKPNDRDLKHYHVELRTASGGGGTLVREWYVDATEMTLQAADIGYGVTRHVRVRAIDWSENASAFTSSVSFSFTRAGTDDISDNAVNSNKRITVLTGSGAFAVAEDGKDTVTIPHSLGRIPLAVAYPSTESVVITFVRATTTTIVVGVWGAFSSASGTVTVVYW